MKSGPNQHYIPRFLQKPFRIPPKLDKVWYFKRNESPVQKAIKRTGSAKYFYSEPSSDGTPTLDDAITKLESQLSQILNLIRSLSIGETVLPTVAAKVLDHLTPRTAHVRETIEYALCHLTNGITNLFADAENIQKLVGLDLDYPTERFREYIFKPLIEQLGSNDIPIQMHVFERFIFSFVKENFSSITRETLPLTSPLMRRFLSASDRIVREAHNKALLTSSEPNQRNDFLLTLDWTVRSAPMAGAILSDCVAIAVTEHNAAVPLMFAEHKDIQAVIMPLSPEKLLVGGKTGYSLPKDFDYNRQAARSSHSFFLSSFNNSETSRLHSMIGERSTFMLEEAVQEGVQEILPSSNTPRAESESDNPYDIMQSIRANTPKFNYKLSLINCGDREVTAQITKKIEEVVADAAQALPLGKLDGITIAGDYPAALETLDRGFESLPPVETVSPEVGVGIGQVVTVVRSTEIKGHIIISSSIAHALISSDPEQVEWAVYILAKELTLVAVIEIIEHTLPGILLTCTDREIDGWLYANVDPALHSYVASYTVAGLGHPENTVNAMRELLVQSIDRMEQTVLEERLAYRNHGNLDQLLAVTLPAVRQVLIFAADLLGFCASRRVSPFDDKGMLTGTLSKIGLTNWFRMYQDQLADFYKRLGKWESFDEFLAFNIHVERLLWQLGMFPWEKPEGVQIDIPLATDISALMSVSGNPVSNTSPHSK